MAYILSLFLVLLLSAPSYAVYLPTSNVLTVGGYTFIDFSQGTSSKFFSLHAKNVTASGGASTFRKPNATSGYSVPASKAFNLLAVKINVITAASGGTIQLAYADNDSGISGASGSISNPVYMMNSDTLDCTTAGLKEFSFPYPFVVPTGKYITINSSTSGCVIQLEVYGYEVDA